MEDIDIIEHCEANEYLFDKFGKCIKYLEVKKEVVNGQCNIFFEAEYEQTY